MAEGKAVWILKTLECPDEVDLTFGASATATGYPLELAKQAARGNAASKVIKELNRGASLNKCPQGCKKELSAIKDEKVEFKCKRVWWTLWTNHRCTCTYTATVTLRCVKKPKTESESEPQVAYLEEVQEARFTQVVLGMLTRFVFPILFLCMLIFALRTIYYRVISPTPETASVSPLVTPEPQDLNGEDASDTQPTRTAIVDDMVQDSKARSLFVAMLTGNYIHYSSYSEIWIALWIVGADPEPVEGAEVAVTMSSPDGSTETLTSTTDVDGQTSFIFTIYTYGTYTFTLDALEAEGYERSPVLDAGRELVVRVGAEIDPPTTAMDSIVAFYDGFNQAFTSGDVDYLFDVLHPEVIARYGETACRSTLETVIENTVQVTVVQVKPPFGDWNWEMDGVSGVISNVYTIDIQMMLPDGTVRPQETHLALRDDGTIGWFTDCGDPIE